MIRSEDICVHSPTLGGTFSLPHLEHIYGYHLPSLWYPDRTEEPTKPTYIHRMLTTHTVPCSFVYAVSEYNTIMVQQQIENIHFTMNLIREDAATISMYKPEYERKICTGFAREDPSTYSVGLPEEYEHAPVSWATSWILRPLQLAQMRLMAWTHIRGNTLYSRKLFT